MKNKKLKVCPSCKKIIYRGGVKLGRERWHRSCFRKRYPGILK